MMVRPAEAADAMPGCRWYPRDQLERMRRRSAARVPTIIGTPSASGRAGALKARPRSPGRSADLGFALEPLDLGLEESNAVRELLERPRKRVGQIHLVEIDLLTHPLTVARRDPSGDADDHGVRGDLADHHRPGADPAARADRERAEHASAGAD